MCGATKRPSAPAAHADDPSTTDALALALDDYAALAGLGGFDAAMIAEARSIAQDLRASRTEKVSAAKREAPAERNGSFAFSTHASGAFEARRDSCSAAGRRSSAKPRAYERKRRSEARRKANDKAAAGKMTPSPTA